MRRIGRGTRWRRSATLALLAAGALVLHAGSVAQQQPRAGAVVLLDIEGAIGPATTDYLRQGFEDAGKRNAGAIILRMDTPGGLDTAMRDIIRAILASSIPVISYVSPSGARAASAGTYILYASHLAAMAPGTNLGAATPVQIGGGGLPGAGNDDDSKDKKSDAKKAPSNALARKAVNDAVAYIRGLAELRGRNVDWAEQAVREAASLPANEALAKNVIEIVAADQRELLAKLDGRTVRIRDQTHTLKTADAQVVRIEPNWRVQILAAITNPNIAYILLLLGVYGLIFEFINPGAVAPGVVGGIALLVGLYALNLLPINFAGVALLLLGIALMVAEAFLPSFGIVGIGGIIAFAIGSLLMFDTDVPGFTLSWPAVALGTSVTAAFFLIAVGAAWRAHHRDVVTGETALLGRTGRVVRWDGDQGFVHIHGEDWQARSEAPLSPGQTVRVAAREDLILVVEPEADAPP